MTPKREAESLEKAHRSDNDEYQQLSRMVWLSGLLVVLTACTESSALPGKLTERWTDFALKGGNLL